MKLYQLPHDKAQHWFYGSLAASLTTLLALWLSVHGSPDLIQYLPYIGIIAASALGLVKEITDHLFQTGTPDLADLLITVLGGAIVSLPLLAVTLL